MEDESEEDSEEDGVQDHFPTQETIDDDFDDIISIRQERRRRDALSPTNHHRLNRHRLTPIDDFQNPISPTTQNPSLGLQNYDFYSIIEQDNISVGRDSNTQSQPEEIIAGQTTIFGERQVSMEDSPNGSPRAKLEEFVPNTPYDRNKPTFRDRVYGPGDIDKDTYHGRVATFKVLGWRSIIINENILARAGFYYDGEEDEVICFRCEKSLRDWKVGDNPLEEHFKNFGYDCFPR